MLYIKRYYVKLLAIRREKASYLAWSTFQPLTLGRLFTMLIISAVEENKFRTGRKLIFPSWGILHLIKKKRNRPNCIRRDPYFGARERCSEKEREVSDRKERSANVYKWLGPKTLQWTLSLTLIKCASFLLFSFFFCFHLPSHAWSGRAFQGPASFHFNLHLLAARNRIEFAVSVGRALRVVTMPQDW